MKTKLALSLSAALLLGAALDAPAARRYNRPRPNPPAAAAPAAAQPVADTHLRKFKELAVNTVFCYPTDRAHEWFPLMKISDTQAKTLVTPAVPVSAVQSLSQEVIVYVSQKKAPTGS